MRSPAAPAPPAPPAPGHASPGLPPLLQRILAARSLIEPELIKRFCEPSLNDLHDPGLLAGIDAAAAAIIDAVRRDQLIVIYGDYDVDGITATAILYHTIKTAAPSARIRSYVPHRLEEGYGLNCQALRQLKGEGVGLVITVDCGITAVASARTARQIGLGLIITDHHELSHQQQVGGDEVNGALPEALAVVHPRLPNAQGQAYPFPDLCGAGVAFKLAWRFATAWCNSARVSGALQQALVNMLPLVALGTIADVCPLVDENRTLAAFGLRLIRQTPLPGVRALLEAASLVDEHVDSDKVGFILAPRLNACGRMGHAADAVRLLTDALPDEAAAIAQRLTQANRERQQVEREIFEQAARLAEDAGMTGDDRRAIVLAHETWHAGVVGIVCSRMVDRFSRPAVLMHRGPDVCKGSARSIDGYSIHEGLSAVAHLLQTFGGHAMAAGMSLAPANLEPFARALIDHATAAIAREQLIPTAVIDCEASLKELDFAVVQQLRALAPFGRGNRSPTLLVRQAVLAEAPRQMGANGRHLSLRVRQDGSTGRGWLRAVWWGAGARAADLACGARIDLLIEPKLNTYQGRTSVEAELKDVRLCGAEG